MTDVAVLVAERRALVEAAVRDTANRLGPSRTPPAVVFARNPGGARNGWYDRGDNSVVIRVDGFLDDPSVEPTVIQATAAHEVGHWADPNLSARMRVVQWLIVPFGAAVLAAVLTPLVVFGRHSFLPLLGLPLGVAIMIAYLFVVAAVRWRAEYFADHVAARVVGAEAVVEFLGTLPSTGSARFSATHPTPAARIGRLRARSARAV